MKILLLLPVLVLTYFISFSQERGYLLSEYSKQWQYFNNAESQYINIQLTDAWKLTTGGLTAGNDEIVIAIIDDGININHPDLKDNIFVNREEIPDNGIDDDNNAYVDDIHGWNFRFNNNDISNNGSGNWHGTPVNGIIGATDENDISGINKRVKLLNIVKGTDLTSIYQSFEYLHALRDKFNRSNGNEGAFVVAVNNSWGLSEEETNINEEWCAWFDKLGEVGIISVVAVPNDDINLDNNIDMPSNCTSEYLIKVSNSNPLDEKVFFAAYGSRDVSLFAPGEYFFTTMNAGDYGYFGGTSASAAYVSATIGLIYSIPSVTFSNDFKAKPAEKAKYIKTRILNSVDKNREFEKLCTSGGRLNIYKTLLNICIDYKEDHLIETLEYNSKIVAAYPNPVKDKFTIVVELQNPSPLSILLHDIQGQIITSKDYVHTTEGNNFISVHFGDIPNGIYFLSLKNYNNSNTIKVVKW